MSELFRTMSRFARKVPIRKYGMGFKRNKFNAVKQNGYDSKMEARAGAELEMRYISDMHRTVGSFIRRGSTARKIGGERKIQLSIMRYLKLKGHVFWRQNSSGIYDQRRGAFRSNPYTMPGLPDIFVLLHDRTVALEVKSGKNGQQESQKTFELAWRSGAGNREYHVVRSVEEVIRLGL